MSWNLQHTVSRRGHVAIVLAAMLALASAAVAEDTPASDPAPYRKGDAGRTVLSILPPGQGRHLNGAEAATGENPLHNVDQISLYDDLTRAAPQLTAESLPRFFKDASFGVRPGDVADVKRPRDGVRIVRDKSFGVPHVYGQSRSDVMYGAGYVTGEDRLFMADLLRFQGRGRLSEFLGASEANLRADRATRQVADYSEAELQQMLDELANGPRGTQAVQDLRDFADGMNQFIQEALADHSKLPAEYAALQRVPEAWKPTDSLAVCVFVGMIASIGGGGSLENAAFVNALTRQGYSAAEARSILNDLQVGNDPEAPTTVSRPFPLNDNLGKVDERAIALPDDTAAAVAAAAATMDGARPPASATTATSGRCGCASRTGAPRRCRACTTCGMADASRSSAAPTHGAPSQSPEAPRS